PLLFSGFFCYAREELNSHLHHAMKCFDVCRANSFATRRTTNNARYCAAALAGSGRSAADCAGVFRVCGLARARGERTSLLGQSKALLESRVVSARFFSQYGRRAPNVLLVLRLADFTHAAASSGLGRKT